MKLHSVATAVRTSDFALLIIILAKGFQEAFVAIVADELVMAHTKPPLAANYEPSYLLIGLRLPPIENKQLMKG